MKRTKIQLLFEHILDAPFIMWVMLGFSMSYLLFFLRPIFLTFPVMQFPQYIPVQDPIGIDLKITLSHTETWFMAKLSPYIGNSLYLYPPMVSVLFMPILFISSSWAYKIVTFVTVVCYVIITFVFPLRIGKERQVSSSLMLVFITGLFSYGLQFELERGQSNVFTFFLCFLAIWIYHYHNRYRYLGYILFIISVQMKVYPLIFIVMLINNWQDWRNNIKRLLLLIAVNFALLFVLGTHVFFDFVNAIKAQIGNPYVWTGNHSIHSFVKIFSKTAYDCGWEWVNQYSGLVQIALLAIVAICIFLIVFQTSQQKQKGISPLLLLACTIGALLIPSISHDYTLSFLAAPVAILFSDNRFRGRRDKPFLHIIFIVVLLIFSAAYSSTLFSYRYKPFILQNNFPALVTMLFTITILSLVSKPCLEEKVSEPIETA